MTEIGEQNQYGASMAKLVEAATLMIRPAEHGNDTKWRLVAVPNGLALRIFQGSSDDLKDFLA